MSRFRLLLAWLVLACLPLQGMAAASMLFCASQAAAAVTATGGGHGAHRAAASSAHDHAAHGGHGHAAASVHNGMSHHAVVSDDGAQQGHACTICASCCQVVAVGGFRPVVQPNAAPGAQPAPAFLRVVTRTSPPPEKPPRA